MTMQELSKEYQLHAEALSMRIAQLQALKGTVNLIRVREIDERIKMLSTMRDEASALSMLLGPDADKQ